jgi:hypothetical protein
MSAARRFTVAEPAAAFEVTLAEVSQHEARCRELLPGKIRRRA